MAKVYLVRGEHQLPEAFYPVQCGKDKKQGDESFLLWEEWGSNLAERIPLEKEGSLALNFNF